MTVTDHRSETIGYLHQIKKDLAEKARSIGDEIAGHHASIETARAKLSHLEKEINNHEEAVSVAHMERNGLVRSIANIEETIFVLEEQGEF